MIGRRLWEIGGFVAGAALILFGAAAIYMGVDGRSTVRDALKQEQITFGAIDDPAVAKYAEQWAGEQVQTGDQARAFAQIMRFHTVNGEWNPDHLTYSQMGRFLAADDPSNPAGTSDEAAALNDEKGNPVSNSFRNTWVTETALTTALNGRRCRAAPDGIRARAPRLRSLRPGAGGGDPEGSDHVAAGGDRLIR